MQPLQAHIAVIGGGASGTLTAIQLMRKLNRPAAIYLIEKRPDAVCRGTAYSSKLEYEPLNVQADRMSAFKHLPDHFFNWVLANRDNSIHGNSFVSRRWYGDYLDELFTQYSRQDKNLDVRKVVGYAQSIELNEAGNNYHITFDNRDEIQADYLVFATGNESPQDIFSGDEVALLGEHYISQPWFKHPFQNMEKGADVLIIGTGLTAVDHIVSLHRRGHGGKVFCFSRNGYLPLQHGEVLNYVFDKSLEQADIKQVFLEVRNAFKNAAAKNVNWQSVIDALRPRVTRIWRNLSIDDKKYFLNYLKNYWEIHRHRMPGASADVLGEMQEAGKLQIVNGRYESVELHNGRVRFTWHDAQGHTQHLFADRILNCTGPSGDYMQGSNALIKNLLVKGWMKQDTLKLGIETGVRGEIIMRNGVVLKNCYAVGPLRKANEWESTAIREIRMQAESIAAYIADKIDAMHDVLVDI